MEHGDGVRQVLNTHYALVGENDTSRYSAVTSGEQPTGRMTDATCVQILVIQLRIKHIATAGLRKAGDSLPR